MPSMSIIFILFITLTYLVCNLSAFKQPFRANFCISSASLSSKFGVNDGSNFDAGQGSQVERSLEPSRYDVFRMYVTGVIGTDPKETYLSNGHYVINFAVATVGHFNPVHDWEKYKPTETMWTSAEIWDDEAKAALEEGIIRKGGKLACMGTMILNKWVDKASGEERKMLKLRILEILNQSDIERMGLTEDIRQTSSSGERRPAPVKSDMWQESPEVEAQVAPRTIIKQSNMRPPIRKMTENSNGDFDGFEDFRSRDPRIPF